MSNKSNNKKRSPLRKTNESICTEVEFEVKENEKITEKVLREAHYKCIEVPKAYTECGYNLTQNNIYESINRMDDTLKIKDDCGKYIEVCAIYFKQV